MLSLYMRDRDTGLTVEHLSGAEKLGSQILPPNMREWSLQEATAELIQKVADAKGVTPVEVAFSHPTFDIVAKWEEEINGRIKR